MTRSLTLKLVRGFLIVSIVGAVLAAVLARWMTVREFNQLVLDQAQSNFINTVSLYYQVNGTWQGVMPYLRQAPKLPFQQPQPKPPTRQGSRQPSFVFVLADQNGIVVVPGRPYHVGDWVPDAELAQGETVEVDGQVVGTVIATGDPPELDPREERYLVLTNQALLYAALGAAGVALVLGIFLARSLTHPLRELTTAIRDMAKGELGQQVPVRSEDEIGELAAAFNQMSADLDRANETRRQMTADIAHDLRTPLTVLGGYLEAMQDGVLQPTPERLETMNTEIQGLIRLVEDLRTLSLADSGELPLNRQLVPPQTLLDRAVAAFSHRAAEKFIELQMDVQPSLPQVSVDPERFHQVLGNLVSNALRYTPEGGRVTLSVQAEASRMVFAVQDTGPGISPEALPYVFDRFFRDDKTREQSNGETGLGLAIAKSIVEAHGGKIQAYGGGQGKGSMFTIELPI